MGLKTFLKNAWNSWRNTWNGGAWCWTEGNGDTYWYHSNSALYHRDNGPAIEYADGRTRYWIHGKYIPQLDNKKIYGKENLQKFLLLI